MKSDDFLVPEYAELSPPSRGAWIEILWLGCPGNILQSPPSRGAWIEMRAHDRERYDWRKVAPLAGGVD